MTTSQMGCCVCFSNLREPDSARCADCSPNRIAPLPHRPRTKVERAALALNSGDSNV
jgi:hypothetical protein